GPGLPPVSRLKQWYSNQRPNQEAIRVAELEALLEDEGRVQLRLNGELLEETTLRVRAERALREAEERISLLEAEERERADKKPAKRSGKGNAKSGASPRKRGEVSKRTQRVDGGTASKRKGDTESADGSSDAVPDGPKQSGGSSRKRGTVK